MPDDLRGVYEARMPILKAVASELERETNEALANTPHIDRLTFRVKEVDSFISKAHRTTKTPYQNPLSEIEDQVAGRVIVFFLDDIETVCERLKGTFNTVEGFHKRHVKRDDAFGYESHHLVCIIPPHLTLPAEWARLEDRPTTFELQIRTIFMHAYSEPQHGIAYKAESELPSNVRRELAWIAASSWGADQAFRRVADWARSKAILGKPR